MMSATDVEVHENLTAAIVDDWFNSVRSMSRGEAKAFFGGLVAPLLATKTVDELRGIADDAPIECCSECGAPLDDGEGYDGLCGTHADVAETAGAWS
jgi:hypothetical protein